MWAPRWEPCPSLLSVAAPGPLPSSTTPLPHSPGPAAPEACPLLPEGPDLDASPFKSTKHCPHVPGGQAPGPPLTLCPVPARPQPLPLPGLRTLPLLSPPPSRLSVCQQKDVWASAALPTPWSRLCPMPSASCPAQQPLGAPPTARDTLCSLSLEALFPSSLSQL